MSRVMYWLKNMRTAKDINHIRSDAEVLANEIASRVRDSAVDITVLEALKSSDGLPIGTKATAWIKDGYRGKRWVTVWIGSSFEIKSIASVEI